MENKWCESNGIFIQTSGAHMHGQNGLSESSDAILVQASSAYEIGTGEEGELMLSGEKREEEAEWARELYIC